MRLINAFKHLIKSYRSVMPTYVLSVLGLLLVSHLAPVIGTVLLLPISIGVARVMINAAVERSNLVSLPILLGFKPTYYIPNLVFLALRQILIYLPLAIGTFISVYVFDFLDFFSLDNTAAIGNLIAFSLPSALISIMFSMVPYLLADERFDQRVYNPLRVSIKIMHGNYIRLILIRLFFAPWIALQSTGLIYLLQTYYNELFGGQPPLDFLRPAFFITPLVILFIMPLYQMVHAELYGTLRHKVKGYQSS
ncbi:MAG: hypothetical protein ACLFPM_04675 [Candidatus Izemoplasmatales bacterium]